MHDVSKPQPHVAQRIGRYTVLEPLGEGGMARVFVAQKDGSPEICVLKRLHVQFEQHGLALRRFQREAHIASSLSHHSIARILDAGLEDGSFCLAMEYIAGETVEKLVEKSVLHSGGVPQAITLHVVTHVLAALAHAHGMNDADGKPLNVVHRDLSPRNIMVSYDGAVKVIDFGIARGDVDDFKTAPGVLMGTPYYMSPEQAAAGSVDRRSDLYTIGAVLFEMLTGQRLVRAKGRAPILHAVAMTPAEAPSSIDPRIPKALDEVVLNALAKHPDDRFQDALTFKEALERALPKVRSSATELGAFVRELFPEGRERAARFYEISAKSKESMPVVEPTRVESSTPPPGTERHFSPMTPPQIAAPTRMSPTPARPEVDVDPPISITDAIIDDGPISARSFSIPSRRTKKRFELALGILALIVLTGLGWIVVIAGIQPTPAPETRPIAKEPTQTAVAARAVVAAPRADRADEPEALEPTSVESVARSHRPRGPAHKSIDRPEEKEKEAPPPADPPPKLHYPAIRRSLDALRAAPKNADLFEHVFEEIRRESEKLPNASKGHVQGVLEPTRMTMDIEGVERAYHLLEKAAEGG